MIERIIARAGRLFRGGERGQVIWLVAGLLVVFGGMTAVAIDLGGFMADRRDHQNRADAIALAASLDLDVPLDEDAVQATAGQWAIKNGIDPSNMTVEVIPQDLPGEPNPKVKVTVQREHGFTFARLVGIESATVSATATAIKTSPAGGSGVVPLCVTQDSIEDVNFGEDVILKVDAPGLTQGNAGPCRIDGPGSGNCNDSLSYCDGLKFGTDSVVCAEGTDTTYCDGPTAVDTQTGNIKGPTETAITWRLDNTDAACDEFGEVFEDDPTTSDPTISRIVQQCNPFLAGGLESNRILIAPVVCVELPDGTCDGVSFENCTGNCEVVIVDFVLVFLKGYGGGGDCSGGNDCEIIGQFARVNQNVGLLAGTFDPEAFNIFVRLVE